MRFVTRHPAYNCVQVQEGALDWLLSVLSATVMHIGPQLLPYKQRLKALLDAVFALPSKVRLHQLSVVGRLANVDAELGQPAHEFADRGCCCHVGWQPGRCWSISAQLLSCRPGLHMPFPSLGMQILLVQSSGGLAACVLPEQLHRKATSVLCCCRGHRRAGVAGPAVL